MKLFILIIIDQFIKIIIHFFFMNKKVSFLNNKIGFRPYLNIEQLSIFNGELNMDLDLAVLIILNCIGLLVIYYFYKDTKKRYYTDNYFENCFLFLTAGTICSLIDKLFWGGSLDYILFFKYIYDIKDIYLCIALVFFIVYIVKLIKRDGIKLR